MPDLDSFDNHDSDSEFFSAEEGNQFSVELPDSEVLARLFGAKPAAKATAKAPSPVGEEDLESEKPDYYPPPDFKVVPSKSKNGCASKAEPEPEPEPTKFYPEDSQRPCYRVFFTTAIGPQSQRLDSGVWFFGGKLEDGEWVEERKDLRVCGVIFGVSKIANPHGEESAFIVDLQTIDQTRLLVQLPKSYFGRSATFRDRVCSKLRDLDFYVNFDCEALLMRFLAQSQEKAKLEYLRVDHTGWLSENQVFIDHRFVVNQDKKVKPLLIGKDTQSVRLKGFGIDHKDFSDRKANELLKRWQQSANLALGNPLVAFAFCLNFAATLQPLVGLEHNAVFNFTGPTTSGKTSLCNLAVSAWDDTHTSRWYGTINGLNLTFHRGNHRVLNLDDLESLTVRQDRELRDILYLIGNGTPKATATTKRELRQEKPFQTLIVSSSERSLSCRFDAIGQSQTGGQLVRWIDLPLTAREVTLDLHNHATPSDLIHALVRDSKNSLGAPAYLFAKRLINTLYDRDLRSEFDTYSANFIDLVKETYGEISNQYQRALRLFALVAFAGEKAQELAVLPWQERSLPLEAALEAVGHWIESLPEGGLEHFSEDSQATIALLEFLRAKQFRHFLHLDAADFKLQGEFLGTRQFLDPTTPDLDVIWSISAKGLKQAFEGMDAARVVKDLVASGFLQKSKLKKLPAKARKDNPHLIANFRCYEFYQSELTKRLELLDPDFAAELDPVANLESALSAAAGPAEINNLTDICSEPAAEDSGDPLLGNDEPLEF